ncbi:NRDE family protein [Streptosporangium sp. KLBMP 9127]|nr:NRDE family protein [Streptosporangium sp. KLBMP 9127]
MCTVIVSFDPDADVPLVLAGVRDEFTDRPWEPPAAYWPGLLGGRDLRAGGTWLAVDPANRRVAALLNGRGVLAHENTRRSRGDLPLRAVAADDLPAVELDRYDPFHLVLAGLGGVRLWHWDGTRLTTDKPAPGTHMIVNSGWAQGGENARVAHFRPRFDSAVRPAGRLGEEPYWGEWATLAAGCGLGFDDPRALVVRQALPDGRTWGTSSVTLLALSAEGVRYDFSAVPADPGAFTRILPNG